MYLVEWSYLGGLGHPEAAVVGPYRSGDVRRMPPCAQSSYHAARPISGDLTQWPDIEDNWKKKNHFSMRRFGLPKRSQGAHRCTSWIAGMLPMCFAPKHCL